MTAVMGCVYSLVLFAFFVAFLVSWFRSREQVRGYKRFGFAAGIIFAAFELLILLVVGFEALLSTAVIVVIADVVGFIRIAVYTIVGIHMCRSLGYSSFPLLKPEFGVLEAGRHDDLEDEQPGTTEFVEPGRQQAADAIIAPMERTGVDDISMESSALDHLLAPPKIKGKRYALIVLAVAIGSIIYSSVLFLVTSPRMSDLAEQVFGEAVSGTDSGLSLLSLLIVLEFAFAEEITFRLGIQNYLAKQLNWQGKKYWIAIALTAALWTLGHTGIMEPGWVKLLQVFPIGLALGWLFRKVGTEGCILAHALFNVGMSVLTPLVFG